MKTKKAEVVSAIGGIVPRPTKEQIISAMVAVEMEKREKEYQEAEAAYQKAEKETKDAIIALLKPSTESYVICDRVYSETIEVELKIKGVPKKIASLKMAEEKAQNIVREKYGESQISRTEIKSIILKKARGVDPDNENAVKRLLDIPAAKRELAEMLDKVFGRTTVKALPEVKE